MASVIAWASPMLVTWSVWTSAVSSDSPVKVATPATACTVRIPPRLPPPGRSLNGIVTRPVEAGHLVAVGILDGDGEPKAAARDHTGGGSEVTASWVAVCVTSKGAVVMVSPSLVAISFVVGVGLVDRQVGKYSHAVCDHDGISRRPARLPSTAPGG